MTATSSAPPFELLPRSDYEPMRFYGAPDSGLVPLTVNNNFYAPVQVYYPTPQEVPLSNSSPGTGRTVANFAAAVVPILTVLCTLLGLSYKQHGDGLKGAVSPFVSSIATAAQADEHLRDIFTLGQNPIKTLAVVAAANLALQNDATSVETAGPAGLSRRASALVKAEHDFVIGAWSYLHDHDLQHVNDLLVNVQVAAHSFESEAHHMQDQSIFEYAFNLL